MANAEIARTARVEARIAPDALAVDAAELMEAHGITSVLVADAAGVLTGVVHIGDLMRAKVI